MLYKKELFSKCRPNVPDDIIGAWREKKGKKEIPAELKAKMTEIKKKVKAGDMTKEEGQAAIKEARKEFAKAGKKNKDKKAE